MWNVCLKKSLLDSPPRNFIDAPIDINEINNLPFSTFAYREISENVLSIRDQILVSLLRKISVDDTEGIMPYSRIEAQISGNRIVESLEKVFDQQSIS